MFTLSTRKWLAIAAASSLVIAPLSAPLAAAQSSEGLLDRLSSSSSSSRSHSTPQHKAPGSPSINRTAHEATPAISPEQAVEKLGLEPAQTRTAATIAEAATLPADKDHIVVTDGHSHVHFERGVDKAAGAYATIDVAGQTYGAKPKDGVSMIAFADSGDVASSLQEAVDVAAKAGTGVTLGAGKEYKLSKRIVIPHNLAYFNGNGARIISEIHTPSFQEVSSVIDIARGTTGTKISDFTLDLQHGQFTRGIAADGVSDIEISNIVMDNVFYRGIQLSADSGDLRDIVMHNNTINNQVGEAHTKGHCISIAVSARRTEPDTHFNNSPSPIWDRYVTDGTVSPNTFEASGLKVTDNKIHGGYYGLSFSGVTNSTVSGNSITANTRNISMQNNSSTNVVESNDLSDSFSSSIHIAYNSDDNQVRNNTVTTSTSTGQGLLQAYQASNGNSFTDNTVTVTGNNIPSWILYVGTDSSNTTFTGNTITGGARKAVVGIESVWDGDSARTNLPDSRPHNPHAYMGGGSVPNPVDGAMTVYNGGRGPLTDITVTNNTFTPKNSAAPLVYVGADVSAGRDGKQKFIGNVTGVDISNNTVVGEEYSEEIVTHSGSLPAVGAATIDFDDNSVSR